MSTNPDARAWLYVRSDALRRNYARLRDSAGPEAALIPMVKADAYGLGMEGVVEALGPEGPWAWGVATLAEALHLREIGREEPVVVFSPLQSTELDAAVTSAVQVSVSSVEALRAVRDAATRTGATARVHVDVDTGMGRTGFDWGRAAEWSSEVKALFGERVEWVGCFTHLHSAEDDLASVGEQWTRFGEALEAMRPIPAGVKIHALNSAGAFAAPGLASDAIRPGIFLYGGAVGARHPAPSPVVSLHARVCHVREAAAGTSLGYGATYAAAGRERWATLSIGYGDGLPRSLGNRGEALVGGRRVPIIGRISMDLTVVDITDVSGVRMGDVATLLGAEGQEEITMDEVAELAGTISYEILTGFTERLPRIWT
jgi:alanine racemase